MPQSNSLGQFVLAFHWGPRFNHFTQEMRLIHKGTRLKSMKTQTGNRRIDLAMQTTLGLLFFFAALTTGFGQTTLTNYLDHTPLDASARKVVILIHGWNPYGYTDVYQQDQAWHAVRDNLQTALSGSDWKLVLYHWESDANSGSVWNFLISDFFDWGTATTAAAHAYSDGGTLGLQLSHLSNLREVQFIAHSAGAWVAQQAAQMLLIKNPFVIVQITLLDPYIPDSVNSTLYPATGLNNSQMSNTQFIFGNDRIRRLENYYADDSIPNPSDQLYPTFGTQDTFAWRAQDINQQVDNGASGIFGIDNYYDYHAGPVQFYADAIQAANGQGVAAGLAGLTPPYTQLGWYRSLYSERNLLPQISTQPQSTTAVNGSAIALSVSATGAHALNYQWFKDNQQINGATSSSYVFTLSPTTVSRNYVVEVVDSYNGARLFSDAASVDTNAPSLIISYVDPSVLTGLPLPQTQPVTIHGSGFTSGCTLTFDDGVDAPFTGRVPTFVNANELDYNIAVGTNSASWTVQVINGTEQSSLGYFSVVSPPPPSSGSLRVTLQPPDAVSAGAQWSVDAGAYHNSGDVMTGLTPGAHTVSCKTISGYTTPASHAVSIVGGTVTNDTETYAAIAQSTYTLTLNAVNGSLAPSPSGWNGSTYVYDSGSVVQLAAYANSGYHFSGWSGDLSGSISPTNITINGNKTITANFASGDPNLATIVVNIQPSEAVTAGAQWKLNSSGWMDSGASFNTSLLGGNYNYIQFRDVSGWITPSPFYVNVSGGQTTNIAVTYPQDTTPGLLTVTLSPPDAVTAGAHWHVSGGTYGNGASVSLTPGSYTVTFDAVSGWSAPASQSVTIQPSGTKVIAGDYTPPAGQPVIGSISPPIGPLSGGTVMTINGANFTAPATVLVGGQSASNISVASSTQITCQTPPSTNYGSASVIVQSSSGTATNANGFAYGLANGHKLDLIKAFGGSCFAIAVQGNYAYSGEGRNLLVLDVSTPSNPSKVGQVALPGVVRGIALLGQYAYVADQEGGLQVVDISTPTSPIVRGFSVTTNYTWTDGITIFGGRAYVANENLGLEIFDLGNPTVPSLISSTNVGFAEAVVVKASTNGVFAYVSTGGSLCVVDVSNPSLPSLRAQTSINGGSCYSIAVSGNYVLAASSIGNLEVMDVSNPDLPAGVGQAPGVFFTTSVGAANNYVYAASSISGKGFYVFNMSGSSLSQIGNLPNLASDGYGIAIGGSSVYIAGRQSGLNIVNISNPYNPSISASFTDSGVYGNYESVAVTGNALCASDGINFKVFDVSQPNQPSLVANVGGTGAGNVVLAQNGIAYLKAGDGVRIYSVATPSSPQLDATIPNSVVYCYGMRLVGTMLYVVGINGSSQPRFVAIDVSNPSSPIVRGTKDFTSFPAGSSAFCVDVSGGKAAVGIEASQNQWNRLSILDISTISTPVELGSVTNTAIPIGIKMSPDGNYAYVVKIENPSALHVLDISDSAKPVDVVQIPLDATWGQGVEIRGNELFAATIKGVYVFDISSPSSPVLTRSHLAPGLYGICVPSDSLSQSGNVYVPTGDGGVMAFREQDIQSPTVFITNPTFASVYTNLASSINLGGGSDDNVGVTAMTWANSRGGSGQVSAPFDNWYVSGTPLYPGSNVLTVTAYDAAGNSGSRSLTVIYPTAKQDQTITLWNIADHTFGDAPILLVGGASSGLPITFSVLSGPASVSSNVLTLTGVGAVTVEATQSGDDLYNPATPKDVSFNVARANQSIDFAPVPDKSAGDPAFTLAAISSSGLPVYFSINSGPATINGSLVSLVGAGTVTVLAWQPGDSNYSAAATVQRSFNVNKIPQAITFGALSPQKVGDAPFPLNATASSGLPVSYSVSGPATLNGNIVTITGYGTVTIIASQVGDDTYAAAANATQSFIVSPPDNTMVALTLQKNTGFQFALYGILNSNYTILASSNLLDWEFFANFTLTNSPMFLIDPAGTNSPRRFYRIAP